MSVEANDHVAAESRDQAHVLRERWSVRRVLTSVGATLAIFAFGLWLTNSWIVSATQDGPRLTRFVSLLGSDMLTFGVPGLMVLATLAAGVSTLSAIFPRSLRSLETSLQSQDGVERVEQQSDDLAAELAAIRARRLMRYEHALRSEDLADDFVGPRFGPPSELDQIKSRSTLAGESSLLFTAMRYRLAQDQDRLRANARINLMIGVFVALVAATILGLPLVNAKVVNQTLSHVWAAYIVRLPVSVLLQLVSFFFLRLYVATENEIKHNKNEVTNIEAKFLAFLLAREGGQSAEEAVKALAQAERNFVLKRGERTVGSENDAHYNDLKSLLDRLISVLPNLPGSKGAAP